MSEREPWASVGDFIKAQRELANLSLRQLAEMANISNPYLGQIERGLYKLPCSRSPFLKNIAGALRISAESMYAQAGLLDNAPAKDGAPGVEEAIRVDPSLSTDQKETLIRIYRGFVEPR